MNIKLAENQSFYLGEEIKVTVKAIYRKGNGQRYVQFFVQAPKNMLVFRDERVAINAQTVNEDCKPFHDVSEDIGNRCVSHSSKFNLKNNMANENEASND